MSGFGGAEHELAQRMQMKIMMSAVRDCSDQCLTQFKDSTISSSENTCLKNCAMRSMEAVKEFGVT